VLGLDTIGIAARLKAAFDVDRSRDLAE